MNLSKFFSLETFFFFFAMCSSFYLVVYYGYIYLNQIEKKYGVEKIRYDNFFSRIRRGGLLSHIAFLTPGSWFYKRFERLFKNDWYAQQYLKKVPQEVILKYRRATWICIFCIVSMLIPDFLNYMGWNFSFYPEKNHSQYLYSNIIK